VSSKRTESGPKSHDGPRGIRRRERDELIAAADREVRRIGTLATLHNHAIAELLKMHPTDQQCLDLLDWAEPLTAGQIADHLGLSTGAVTGLLDRLEAGRWVRRERDPADRRRVLVRMREDHGPEACEAYRPLSEAIDAYWASLSDEALQVVVGFLKFGNTAIADATVHARNLRARNEEAEGPARDR
jgi:DNA-binding MarR family transcriptional regulator